MTGVVSVVSFVLIAYLVVARNHRALIFICILSIFSDLLFFDFGARILVCNLIGFLLLPFIINNVSAATTHQLKWKIRPIYYEYLLLVVLGLIYGFLIPWEDKTGLRSWSQLASGRSVITLIRLFNEFLVAAYIFILVVKDIISVRKVVFIIAVASCINVVFAIVDFYAAKEMSRTILSIREDLTGRFTGLNGEPKALGRNSALGFSVIFAFLQFKRFHESHFLFLALALNIVGVIISLSASSLILFILLFAVLTFTAFTLRHVALICIISLLTLSFVVDPQFFKEETQVKIEKALFASDDAWVRNEPDFFRRFDLFDRLALIFFLKNPEYLLFGVGPNLISLPASEYIPAISIFSREGRIDSVPNVMFNNILARSGIVGVLLYGLALTRLYRSFTKTNLNFGKSIFLIAVVFSMVYYSIVFYFLLAFSLAIDTKVRNSLLLLNTKHVR